MGAQTGEQVQHLTCSAPARVSPSDGFLAVAFVREDVLNLGKSRNDGPSIFGVAMVSKMAQQRLQHRPELRPLMKRVEGNMIRDGDDLAHLDQDAKMAYGVKPA